MSALPSHVHHGPHGAWMPQHSWHQGSTSIDGEFEDGTQVAVATWLDPRYAALRTRAWHEWLHGRVLVVETTDEAPVVIVPLDRLSDASLSMAMSAFCVGHATVIAG